MAGERDNATIISRVDTGPDLMIIRVRPDVGEVPEFLPGQYAELAFPSDDGTASQRLVRRAYSIASAADVRDHFEFYVVHVPDGVVTPKLWTTREGGRLWLGSKVKGKFTLDGIPPKKDLVMVATGTGIAPYVSMIRSYRGVGRWRKVIVIHGARLAHDLGYRAELEELSGKDDSIVYIPTLTREPEGSSWRGFRGRVLEVLAPEVFLKLVGEPLDPAQCEVFLCGNPQMIDDAEELLKSRGFREHHKKNPGNLHFERYW